MLLKESWSMKVYGYQCKTPGCQAWIKTGEMLEDSPHAMSVLLELGANPKKIMCTACRQTHEYDYSEREVLRLVDA
jgi:hypothetical protein